eukprot:CAMPEP_0197689896 /NCGR_PEP_ID=MMETSP1338-20131121/107530_1 /TAXON_ID=43686 ORGANISM="Pelagodinium beii, Strain RCC1491" /NCGR_SAMPLE_ID=MMETSP1338 /ASSEMBLY_ACC=CAM_ASM_000754 /LENGTH=50 /DNA_ID=CAMNT_0043272283 /DNA_START=224 /DNA_END=373 /DNA_ORIENTATION=-
MTGEFSYLFQPMCLQELLATALPVSPNEEVEASSDNDGEVGNQDQRQITI